MKGCQTIQNIIQPLIGCFFVQKPKPKELKSFQKKRENWGLMGICLWQIDNILKNINNNF